MEPSADHPRYAAERDGDLRLIVCTQLLRMCVEVAGEALVLLSAYLVERAAAAGALHGLRSLRRSRTITGQDIVEWLIMPNLDWKQDCQLIQATRVDHSDGLQVRSGPMLYEGPLVGGVARYLAIEDAWKKFAFLTIAGGFHLDGREIGVLANRSDFLSKN